jgi:putative transposase
MGLQLRNKSPKRRVKAQLREDRSSATAANQIWAMDFVHDQLFDGRKIRVLTIVDTFTRLSPVIDVRQSYRGSDVVETLERVIPEVVAPRRSGSTMGGVHQQGARPVGFHARRHTRLQPARQADG